MITNAIVVVLLRLDGLPLAPHYSVALLLDGSLKTCLDKPAQGADT